MGRNSIVAVLSLTTALMGARYAVAGQAPAAASDPDIPISHQESCSGRSILALRCRPISVRSIRASCWCTGWGFRPITAPLPLSPSARMP